MRDVNRELSMMDPEEYILSKNPSKDPVSRSFNLNLALSSANFLPKLLLELCKALYAMEASNSDQTSTHQYQVIL